VTEADGFQYELCIIYHTQCRQSNDLLSKALHISCNPVLKINWGKVTAYVRVNVINIIFKEMKEKLYVSLIVSAFHARITIKPLEI
jgi:hypothetical protein